MPKDSAFQARKNTARDQGDHEEAQSLLAGAADEEVEVAVRPNSHPHNIRIKSQRQPSLLRPFDNSAPRTPRTANRVRFDIADRTSNEIPTYDHARDASDVRQWIEDEDYLSNSSVGGERSSTGQRAPLLTGIEAPSVTVADTDLDFNAEDLLESARPKSGLRSAFMNMANSIM